MANLIIEMPDDLARSLEGVAAAQRKSIQQLALERLIALVEGVPEPVLDPQPRSCERCKNRRTQVRRTSRNSMPLIAAGRLPIGTRLFGLITGDLSSRYKCDQHSDAGDSQMASWLSSIGAG